MDAVLAEHGQPVELSPGEVLDGKYRIERLLGVGGMGAVYQAERLALQDRVAIKSILSSQNTESNRARFLREARAAASIRHPNVVKIFDFGEPADRPPYMVMELLEGVTLSTLIRDGGALPLARALWIFSGVCAAVEAGHRRGVVHRDLKPGNVILARADDGREVVKVLDFGLARVLQSADVSALTSPGSMIGTCSYMAPELLEAGKATPASDVYALGVMLYEMVTGKSPFRADNPAATVLRITMGDYEAPGAVAPDLPQEVCAGIEAALFRDPPARPRSPEELAARVGAPLAQSASEAELPERERIVDVSAVGPPADLEPSLSARAEPAVGEITTSEHGPNLDGGERTTVGADALLPQASRAFVGRARELELLRREYRLALEGRGRIAVVSGDAGVGKSRLLEAFAAWAQGHGATVLRGRFFAYEGDHPPPHETFVWMLADGGNGSSSDAATQRGSRPGAAGLQPTQDKWHAFSRLAAAFSERTRGRPLVLVVEDLQWATALDLEFLAYLPRAIERGIVAVVGTARTGGDGVAAEEMGRWLARLGSQRALTSTRLKGFGIGEVRAWFQACLPGIRIRPQDVRKLQNVTSGNPYFLSEVVGQLVDVGTIRRAREGWVCGSLDRVDLPETVNAVVRAKLEGLDDELRTVLEHACVIGEEFRFETLQRAIGIEEDVLEELIERAVKRQLLAEDGLQPGSDYRFDNATLREVLYGSLGKRRRRRLHRTVVDAINALYADGDADRIAKVLCYHYDAVEDHRATFTWGLRAAAETLSRHDCDHAEASLARARAAADALAERSERIDLDDAARLELLTGELFVRIGRLQEADEALARASALVDAGVTRAADIRLDVLVAQAECKLAQGDLEAGLRIGREAIATAQQAGDRRRELGARLHAAKCAAPHGELDEAAALLAPVVDAGEPELASLRSQALSELAWVHTKRGSFDRAVQLTHTARDVARECGDSLAEYRAVSVLGLTYLEGGDQQAAIERLEQALELARRLSLRRREGVELHNLGECYYFLGRYDEALARSRQAQAIFVEIRDRSTEGDARINVGRTLHAQGNFRDALDELRAGLELAAKAGRSEYEGLARLELGLIHLAAERHDDARTELVAARDRFAAMGSLYLWRAELALARLSAAIGDSAATTEHARRASQIVQGQRERIGTSMSDESLARSLDEISTLIAD